MKDIVVEKSIRSRIYCTCAHISELARDIPITPGCTAPFYVSVTSKILSMGRQRCQPLLIHESNIPKLIFPQKDQKLADNVLKASSFIFRKFSDP